MALRPSVTYKPCATSWKEQTGDIITLAQFEEGGLFSETYNNAESGDKSDSGQYHTNVNKPPLFKMC